MAKLRHKTHNWPNLPYLEWKSTYETLHRWVQIVGKLRLSKSPWVNHSWHTTFYVTSRGLTTSAIPDENRNITVNFDFIDHKLIIETSDGKEASFMLRNERVSSFYARFQGCLHKLNISYHIDPHPNETSDSIPFNKDTLHCTYEPQNAHRFWQVLVRVSNVMANYRSNFVGKSSPVHFFWGSFDLAVSRFSGRVAPEHPAGVPHIPDAVVKEAYSHEVMSCGFWPGNELYPYPAFYSYIYPEPPDFKNAIIEPFASFYHETLKEFILPYEIVTEASDPESVLLSFFESSYQTAAELADWDRPSLENSPYLRVLKDLTEVSHSTENFKNG